MNLQAQHDCGLSKYVQAARLSPVASNASNSGASNSGGSKPKTGRPGQLRQTLTDLESALSSWDQIVPDVVDDTAAAPTVGPARARGSGVPEEMKRRTRELLNQLKEQIDELSSEESPGSGLQN
jgi:hypothetical protein